METRNERLTAEMLQDKKWHARMCALESIWLSKIAEARVEYDTSDMRRNKKR
jgi:hypothetical protein